MGPEILLTLCKSPPLVPILSQMNPAHNFPPFFPKIRWVLSSPRVFRQKFSMHFLSLPLP